MLAKRYQILKPERTLDVAQATRERTLKLFPIYEMACSNLASLQVDVNFQIM
jgi:hypothetical protein